MIALVRRNAKAVAAFVCSLVAMIWLRLSGHGLDPTVEKSLEAVLVGIIVWAIPNRNAP